MSTMDSFRERDFLGAFGTFTFEKRENIFSEIWFYRKILHEK
jgi:hypothetical protein